MNKTPEMRNSEIKGFIRLQKEQGGIVPSSLKDGQTMLIEAGQYVYQIKVLDLPVGRRYMVDTGSPNCRGHNVCFALKAHSGKLKYEIPDWIGKDMRMLLIFTDGTQILAGEVKSASVKGTKQDGSEYNYEFWQNID